MEQETDGGELF